MNKRRVLFAFFCSILFFAICSSSVPISFAEDEEKRDPGAEFLDQATEEKITAKTLDDLGKVIQLCERAEKAGLNEDNLEFCKQLRSATQMQRGVFLSALLVDGSADGNLPRTWKELRHTALNDLEEAIKLIPDSHQAYFYIARLNLLPEGDVKRGKEALDLAIEKSENAEQKSKAIMLKALLEENKDKKLQLLREARETTPDAVIVLLACALNFTDANQLKEAQECLDHALELEPENLAALDLILDVYARQKEFEKSIETLEKLEKLLPDNNAILEKKAKMYFVMGQTDEALKVLEEARAKDPNNPELVRIRAAVHLSKGEIEKAQEDVDALKKFSLTPEGQTFVGKMQVEVYCKQKKYVEATRLLDQLISDSEYKINLELVKVMVLIERKANSRALSILDTLLEKPKDNFQDSDYFRTLQMRGDVLLALGRHSKAVEMYKKAYEIDPNDPGLLNNYSWVMSTTPIASVRNGELALEYAKKAAEMTDYKVPHILSTLGAAYAELEDFDKAKEYSKKAIELAEKEKHERLDDLKKEIEAYEQKKPFREYSEEDVDLEDEEEETKEE